MPSPKKYRRRKSRRRWLPALVGGGAGVALIAAILLFVPWDTPAAQGMAGEPGVLQDGAYYVYVGSGFALPNQNRTPEGIFRYIPGQGAEELVSCENYDINILADLGWRVNSHGLYFIDSNTGQLYRQDLATGEQTVLFTIPEEDLNPPEVQWEGKDLWNYFVHDQPLEAPIPSAIWLLGVSEDTVALAYRYTDGSTTDTLVLDSRTGDLRSKTRNQAGQWTQYVGDRAIAVVLRTQDPETGQQWVDLREKGVSLLPAGAVAQAPTADFQGGLLAWYTDQGEGTGEGAYLLLPQAGGVYSLPAGPAGEARTYLAAAQGWVYYTARQEASRGTALWARNLATGEAVPLLERCNITGLVTDGTWCYCTNGSTTDCYRLDWDGQGRPTGLTLIERAL